MGIKTLCGVCLALMGTAGPAPGQDPFAANVRPTDPLSPAEEQKAFHLPEGFEIQLFASEPEIQKPLNMAFDAKGRLWLTDTQEYPGPAPPDRPGKDTIKVLEDTDGDGRADKITTFADDLNIPIGLYPYQNGCIAFSIPHIWRLEDTDGDGRSNLRKMLYGPMGVDRDTHGLNNSFRRGFDGWLYACHGFNNHTEVAGTDGHKITMHSGNTYRMRLDGSRIEHFTHGQVNPFGMAFDEWGNQFTADCHSKPLTQLLRGAYYPSFGKPHGGLGFVSPMMDHNHGSTAIAGVASISGDNFPKEYRGNLISGNVMTSRVNRNSLVYHGSTIRAKAEPDFVTTDDPWFRPVDVRMGPDGALYIADFYNRIIGHYEVPLDHPGRDRHRGRIWRIVYTGSDPDTKPPRKVDLSTASTEELIESLQSPNLTVRMLATDQLSDRIGQQAGPALKKALRNTDNAKTQVHSLWGLFRLNDLDEDLLAKAASDESPLVRTHAMKVLAETADWSPEQWELAERGLGDQNAFVRRAAADAVGRHPHPPILTSLQELLRQTPKRDDHLRHVVRMAIRNQLRRDDAFAALIWQDLSQKEQAELVEIALAVESSASASFVLDRIASENLPADLLEHSLVHAVRFLPADQTDRLVKVAREKCAGDGGLQFRLLKALHAGLLRRGVQPGDSVRGWVEEVVQNWLQGLPGNAFSWTSTPLPHGFNRMNPWILQKRKSADGDSSSWFFCSLPLGEPLTGRLRSKDFSIPERLSFYAAGHVGPPNQPVAAKNFIRLRDAKTNRVLKESRPPRHDTARRFEWDLKEFAGRRGYLEIVDGDTRKAYAWLAVGRFEPDVVPLPAVSPRDLEQQLITVANLSAAYEFQEANPAFVRFLKAEPLSPTAASALIRAVGRLSRRPDVSALSLIAEDPAVPEPLCRRCAKAAANPTEENLKAAVTDAFRQSPARLQSALAEALTGNARGRDLVLELTEKGIAPARMLLSPTLKDRLLSTAKTDQEKEAVDNRIEALTASLPPADEAIEKLLKARLAGFLNAKADRNEGRAVFKKHCAACHQVAGEGALIGPQLDGIGNRGIERLLEDVLDPNRNVDVAFRTTTIALNDGTIHTGLVRRDEGAIRILADQKGQEFPIRIDEIAQERKSRLSLMPANVAEILSEQEFYDLIAFLASKRSAEVPKPGIGVQRSQVSDRRKSDP